MSLVLLFHYLLLKMFRMLVHPSSGTCDLLWIYFVCPDGRTTYQPVLTTFLQPRHIPTQGYNITQSSAPDDGHMVARNMLSNY